MASCGRDSPREKRSMKSDAREWVEKAERDYHSAGTLLRARRYPDYDGACYHAQQCAEKYMKAVLVEADKRFERTHELSKLLNELLAVNPLWEVLRPAAEALSEFAVRIRYPGSTADKPMAREAIRASESI